MHPKIFHEFERIESLSDGESVYDFLGGRVNCRYKRGLERSVRPAGTLVRPNYPAPSEWTVDWIACLIAAKLAGKQFNVIELGAGYGQWTVASILAYKKLYPHLPVSALAIEADEVHFDWLNQHINTNLEAYKDIRLKLMNVAAGFDGSVRFPVLDDPAHNYGAAYALNSNIEHYIEVDCLSLSVIFQEFNEPRVDLLHVDIQGAELDLLDNSRFVDLLSKVNVTFFGTHKNEQTHNQVRESLEMAGLIVLIDWPRNSLLTTPFGEITTTDGALLAVNKSLVKDAIALI